MPVPEFFSTPPSNALTLKRNEAAARLGIARGSLDKLISAGILPIPVPTAQIEALASRPWLRVREGELTVLRTGARADAYPGEGRQYIGFHVDHTPAELEATSLRWWRCDPARVMRNELFAVTISTIPVAVYRITAVDDQMYRDDEDKPRFRYAGELLSMWPSQQIRKGTSYNGLATLVQQIMSSRIAVSSGGPIGYLEPAAALADASAGI